MASNEDNGYDDPSVTTAANRSGPIPVIPMPSINEENDDGNEKKGRKRDIFKFATDKIKDSLPDSTAIQDKLLEGIMAQIIPAEDWKNLDRADPEEEEEENGGSPDKKDKKSRKSVDKAARESPDKGLGGLGGPDFGPRLIAVNMRRFTQRVGILFSSLEGIIYLLSWQNQAMTGSFLAIYSLLCLKPHLIAVLPFMYMIFVILLPAFLVRHPTSANDPRLEPSFYGPATAPPSRLRPAADLSKDFFRNARDLQNSMEDFSRAHDAANLYVEPLVNFSDESLSTTLFVGTFVLACLALIASSFIPWQGGALVIGWALIGSLHPTVQALIASSSDGSSLSAHLEDLQTIFRNWIESDILLDGPPQLRQVEIFELQKHHVEDDSWEAWLYSASAFEPLSAARISGARPRGTQFFEDVQAPSGWRWKEKKWTLDLASREWVEQRLITGVEIETDGDRWVYDVTAELIEQQQKQFADASSPQSKLRGRRSSSKGIPKSGWEEGTGLGERGEWRRRRWTRLVEKKIVGRVGGSGS